VVAPAASDLEIARGIAFAPEAETPDEAD